MATEVYRCIHCGAEIEPNRKRCRECGRGLEEVAQSGAELPGRVAQWPLLLILLFGLGSTLWGIRHAMRNLSAPRVPGPDHDQVVALPSPEPNPLLEPAPAEPTPPKKTEPSA